MTVNHRLRNRRLRGILLSMPRLAFDAHRAMNWLAFARNQLGHRRADIAALSHRGCIGHFGSSSRQQISHAISCLFGRRHNLAIPRAR